MKTLFHSPLVLMLCVLFFMASTSRAVIVFGGTGTQNTTAPPDDPGWNNVGVIGGGATGVYLGNSWVLTANHVGAGSIVLAGTNYNPSGSSVRLKNPNNTDADLLLYQILGNPLLPSVRISSNTPANGSSVTMIGFGRNRDPNITKWDNNWLESPTGTREGYKWAPGNTMRWGQNTIIGSAFLTNFNTFTFETKFSASLNNAEGSTGDSGGAAFFKNGLTWELAGIIDAIATFSGQPFDTSVYQLGVDGDRTYMADLAQYQGQIVATVPEPQTVTLFVSGILLLAATKLRRKTKLFQPDQD
ncbi:MAG: S1 family peptidase [Verrucomicrobiota bacterium]|nr:S1 family peptidase [Verrucomicrobiota bacterium]